MNEETIVSQNAAFLLDQHLSLAAIIYGCQMKFRTEIDITPRLILGYQNPILFLGSCFSENIGEKLKEFKFDISQNPFGILYQPAVIANSLFKIINREYYLAENLVQFQGLWHTFDHHGRFSGRDSKKVLSQINENIDQAYQKLSAKGCVLAITWGTAWGYTHLETEKAVANCHKMPAKYFRRCIENPESIENTWHLLITALNNFNPTLKIIFTISPVRHWRDGAIENQHSKSILFVSLHKLLAEFKFADYFPAYEILMDELRDYRFYAEDMLHPSSQAVDFVWEKFKKSFIDADSQDVIAQLEPLLLALKHRPLHPQSSSFDPYIEQINTEAKSMLTKYPFLDLEDDLEQWNQKINIAKNEF